MVIINKLFLQLLLQAHNCMLEKILEEFETTKREKSELEDKIIKL